MLKVFMAAAIFLHVQAAAEPAVTKVEPPDWISQPAGIILRMLVTGSGFGGAAVRSKFGTGAVKVSASGTHLFFDLYVPPGVTPGKYPVQISTGAGKVEAAFAIVPALATSGRFQGFSSDDVMYLIMPDRFANGDPSNDDPAISQGLYDRTKSRYYHGGDFQGIIDRLPYLKSLGVTALWLTPIVDNSNRLNHREKVGSQPFTDYHGYGAVDFYGVDEHFGDLAKLRELVDKAHTAGIKIIQDQVANHTGPFHPWVKDPPTPGWFNGSEEHHQTNTFQVWTLTGPHAAPGLQKSTLEGWFAGILPDLNQNDPEVARYLIQNTLWWIGRTGIDGIREDTLPYVPRSFWHEWTTAIRQHYPRFHVVGEVFASDPALVSFFQGGKKRWDGIDSGVDTLFDFPLQAVIGKVFRGAAPMRDLDKVLAHDYLYQDANRLVDFADLHDLPRFMNEKGATADGLQRMFSFLMTVRGIPLIYYGDEVGMAGGNDPDNRRDFPGGWKQDAHNAFEQSGRTVTEQAIFAHVQKLARIRAALEPLRRGKLVSLWSDENAYVFVRATDADRVLVAFNNSAAPMTLQVAAAGSAIADGATMEDQLGAAGMASVSEGTIELRLAGHSAAIYH